MMFHVIPLEGNGTGYTQGQVRHETHDFIVHGFAKQEIVRGFVHREHQHMIGRAANDVADREELPPGFVTNVGRRGELEDHEKRRDVFRLGIMTIEFLDFGIFGQNGHAATGVGFIGVFGGESTRGFRHASMMIR